MSEKAIVLRLAPGGVDKLPEALAGDFITIGWSRALGLQEPNLEWEDFRQIVSDTYHPHETNLRRAGAASGHLWRFLRELEHGSLVVVPYWNNFYVCEVQGDAASYDAAKLNDDSCYRRSVIWKYEGNAIPRSIATAALISRMKVQGTTASASDLIDEISLALASVGGTAPPTFHGDLKSRLVREALDEIRTGRMESYGFERLIGNVLRGMGATDVRIIARNRDKGADLLADFLLAGTFPLTIAVQAKHWQGYAPVGKDVVEQLTQGLEVEAAQLGMIVTSGVISEEATQAAEQYFQEKGIRIALIDGEQFAKLIIERGILIA